MQIFNRESILETSTNSYHFWRAPYNNVENDKHLWNRPVCYCIQSSDAIIIGKSYITMFEVPVVSKTQ